MVVAQFYGHKHTDSFRLIRSEEGKSVGFGLVQGSVSPLIGSNPSVRLYSYSNASGLEDFVQYFLDLQQVHAVRNISAVELGTSYCIEPQSLMDSKTSLPPVLKLFG